MDWILGWPAGFKANDQLNLVLGQSTLACLAAWRGVRGVAHCNPPPKKNRVILIQYFPFPAFDKVFYQNFVSVYSYGFPQGAQQGSGPPRGSHRKVSIRILHLFFLLFPSGFSTDGLAPAPAQGPRNASITTNFPSDRAGLAVHLESWWPTLIAAVGLSGLCGFTVRLRPRCHPPRPPGSPTTPFGSHHTPPSPGVQTLVAILADLVVLGTVHLHLLYWVFAKVPVPPFPHTAVTV